MTSSKLCFTGGIHYFSFLIFAKTIYSLMLDRTAFTMIVFKVLFFSVDFKAAKILYRARLGIVVPNTATFELSYSVSHIRTNTTTGFEKLYSKKNIHCYE